MKLQDTQGYTLITQKSINNVKCTRIISGEGSDKYNKYIQYLAKKILMLSANRTDGHKNDEVGILARLDGYYESQPIYGYWDEKAKTSIIMTEQNIEYNFMIDEYYNTQSLVFVHNHPNNSNISLNDILSLLGNSAIAIAVAVGNNGDIHYASKENNNNLEYFKLYKNIQNYLKSKESVYNTIYKYVISNQNKHSLRIR